MARFQASTALVVVLALFGVQILGVSAGRDIPDDAAVDLWPSQTFEYFSTWLMLKQEAATMSKSLQFFEQSGALYLAAQNNVSTILAPTDTAFAALPESISSIINSADGKTLLSNLMNYHVATIYDPIDNSQPSEEAAVPNLLGAPLFTRTADGVISFYSTSGQPSVNSATAVKKLMDDSKIVIFAIDRVLLPSDLSVLGVPSLKV